MLGNARIDPLITPARDDNLIGASQVLNQRLSERCARRSRDRENTPGRGRGGVLVTGAQRDGEHLIEGTRPHVRAHDHAGATTIGSVVDAAVLTGSPLPQVMGSEGHEADVLRLAHEGEGQGREIVGENGDEIKTHATCRPAQIRPGHRTSLEARQ